MHHPTDRIKYTTAFVTPVVEHWLEREIAQWAHHEGSIHCTMTEHYYHRATSRSVFDKVLILTAEHNHKTILKFNESAVSNADKKIYHETDLFLFF